LVVRTRIINAIIKAGIIFNPSPSAGNMPDETDRIFYDTAKECGEILITGNSRHYPNELFTMKPADFIRKIINKFE